MLIRIEDKDVEDAAEEVRKSRGDRSRTETVRALIIEEQRRRLATGCIEKATPKRARKGAKS
jgi:hypothetical protein